jgi:hypothetical protein
MVGKQDNIASLDQSLSKGWRSLRARSQLEFPSELIYMISEKPQTS